MALKIKWSPRAASNLEETCDYIAKDSEYNAILFAKKVTAIVKTIPQFPKSGWIVPEYPTRKDIRRVYRLKSDLVEIVAICHGTKPLESIL